MIYTDVTLENLAGRPNKSTPMLKLMIERSFVFPFFKFSSLHHYMEAPTVVFCKIMLCICNSDKDIVFTERVCSLSVNSRLTVPYPSSNAFSFNLPFGAYFRDL